MKTLKDFLWPIVATGRIGSLYRLFDPQKWSGEGEGLSAQMVNQTSLPETPSASSPLGAIQTRDLIRAELDRNNKYLEFAQGQIQKDRDFYKHLYRAAGAFIVFIVAVAGFFQYTSVSQNAKRH